MSEENKTVSDPSQDRIQTMVDASVSKSVQAAIVTLQDTITKSMNLVLARATLQNPSDLPPRTPSDQYWSPKESVSELAKGFKGPGKSKSKRRHLSVDPYSKPTRYTLESHTPSKSQANDSVPIRGINQSDNTSSTLEEAHSSKRKKVDFRSKPDSFRESSSEDSDHSDIEDVDDILYISEEGGSDHDDPALQDDTKTGDSNDPFFDPSLIYHPRSGEWLPEPKVAEYLAMWVFKSLDKASRSKLKSECPRPSLPHNSSATPELDPLLNKFLFKTGKNPKKGIDRSFKACQDKLMDLLGPLTKILNLAELASNSNTSVDTETLKGWAQRAICLFGNANAALSTERKRSILMKIDPQLTNLASTEPPNPTKGLLFGDEFIKEMNKYVGLFSSLSKAQVSMKKVFSQKIFGKAGRGRGRSSSRSTQYRPQYRTTYNPPQPSFTTPTPTPFFPYRGRPWRARGQRGYPRSRPSSVQQ
ncbi:uncharacterized protein LOC130346565 [Hyla sarda]|uniref:uncharacterized protein LOC130284291 n=1 Tax=Hyla sarda TaxID=327740 RepID=UPI0024C2D754|nr:uncharacterized protein LOC130284291 [Hyla sarda]XP_056390563.1 uncharacterized protein LOC130284334 [Hyla sarda]XP_056410548.1 uncharacterized protein LOC130346565 [Hyla sarda]